MPLPLNLPLTITVLAWGFNFVALKVLYEEVSTPAVSLLRFGLMYLVLLALCPLVGESLRFPREDRWRLLFFGFMSMGFYMVLFLEGLQYSGPAESAILLNTSPIITMLMMAAIGNERLRAGGLVGAVIAFLGVVLVVLAGSARGETTLLGSALILASAVVWAYCVVLMKPLLDRYSPLRVLTLSMPGGLAVLVPYGLMATLQVDYAGISSTGWLMFLHVSLISGVVAFICFYKGVRLSGGSGAMLAMYFVPPTAALFSWLVLKRTLGPLQFVGLGVVIFGVAVAQRNRVLPAKEPQPAVGPECPAEGTI